MNVKSEVIQKRLYGSLCKDCQIVLLMSLNSATVGCKYNRFDGDVVDFLRFLFCFLDTESFRGMYVLYHLSDCISEPQCCLLIRSDDKQMKSAVQPTPELMQGT